MYILYMKKNKVIIITIITFFILAGPGEVFSLAAPIEDAYWCNNFGYSRSYDLDNSTVVWENGIISLREQQGEFSSSGVLWTGDIRFSQDIYSLVLSGLYFTPGQTSVMGFVRFDNDVKEYALAWNSVYEPEKAVRKLRLKIFLSTNDTSVSPTVDEICLSAKLQDRSERGIVNRDSKRVSDLKSMRNVIQKYYDDFGHYPVVNINKNNKEDQWRLLKDILESASASSRKNYTRGFKSQPIGVDSDYKYGYLTGGSGSYFLLWAQLEQNDSEHFEESWNDAVLDIDCSSPTYCICSKVNITPEPIIQYFEDSEEVNEIQGAEFIRQENDTRVYLKTGGYRVWLRTPKIFEKAGGLWNKVNIFTSKIADPLLKFVKKANESTVYLISNSGFKRAMLSEQMLGSYGQLSEVVTVDDDVIDLLPENYLIRAKGDIKVYFLNQKIKRWITSPNVLERLGFDFSQVVEVDPAELDFYAEGNPIF